MSGVSETYVTDEPEDIPGIGRVTPVSRIDDADERIVIERTDLEREAFRAKLQDWRNSKSIPNYTGPKAAR